MSGALPKRQSWRDIAAPAGVAALSLSAIVGVGLWRHTAAIESHLRLDAMSNVVVDLPEVELRFEGRDAVLAGQVDSPSDREALRVALRHRWGVRAVDVAGLRVSPTQVPVSSGEVAAPKVPADSSSPTRLSAPTTTPLSTTTPTSTTSSTSTTSTAVATTTTVAPAALARLEADLAAALRAEPVNFTKNIPALDPASGRLLDRIAALLATVPTVRVSIEAHTDGSGSTSGNLLLSQARADLVRSALVDRGVAADRLTATGLGESQPVASDASNGGRARNRRVEIHVRA